MTFFMNQARPWPHPNSVYVNSDIIIVVYNQAGLEDFRRRLQMLTQTVTRHQLILPLISTMTFHSDITVRSCNSIRPGNDIRSERRSFRYCRSSR